MGLMDEIKKKAEEAKSAISGHSDKSSSVKDKVGEGIDTVAEEVDEKTGGKHTKKIEDTAGKAKDALGIEDTNKDGK
ncbi:antitoxin [Streptomyces sp. A7024]|uniref:Antitoxin n=1 Tax=Streptomyces coryli TaxID=1128680 RepID=A0A6G4UBJ7_9ACTN|nr:Rv0909 family putative TA system antitoxin [Streptomyces coryli]NGN68561.1 antitoxin [Streptomyces coryli]